MKARLLIVALALAAVGCGNTTLKTLPRVSQVDIPRFMGSWYVIAHIPSYIERNAYTAVESYELKSDGRIQTTFSYRNGSFDAPLKSMKPVGTVQPQTGNAVWGMQFIWPIKAEYVIAYLKDDYSLTIIGRSARDYAWIMARTPEISPEDLAFCLQKLRELGYDTTKVRRVPQASASNQR